VNKYLSVLIDLHLIYRKIRYRKFKEQERSLLSLSTSLISSSGSLTPILTFWNVGTPISSLNEERIIKDLEIKASGVSWHKDKRTEFFLVVARSFSHRPHENNQWIALDLNDLMHIFLKCRNFLKE